MHLSIQISCPLCGWQILANEVAVAERLRTLGMLRREKEPDAELILQLLPGAAPQMACPDCEAVGLNWVEESCAEEGGTEEDWEAGGWQDAVLCEVCRGPIPPERLDALPGAVRCAACQTKHEEGTLVEEPDFCPKCGSLLVVRVSRGSGITRYKSFCTGDPACRL